MKYRFFSIISILKTIFLKNKFGKLRQLTQGHAYRQKQCRNFISSTLKLMVLQILLLSGALPCVQFHSIKYSFSKPHYYKTYSVQKNVFSIPLSRKVRWATALPAFSRCPVFICCLLPSSITLLQCEHELIRGAVSSDTSLHLASSELGTKQSTQQVPKSCRVRQVQLHLEVCCALFSDEFLLLGDVEVQQQVGNTPLDYWERTPSDFKSDQGRDTKAALRYHSTAFFFSLQKMKGLSYPNTEKVQEEKQHFTAMK